MSHLAVSWLIFSRVPWEATAMSRDEREDAARFKCDSVQLYVLEDATSGTKRLILAGGYKRKVEIGPSKFRHAHGTHGVVYTKALQTGCVSRHLERRKSTL